MEVGVGRVAPVAAGIDAGRAVGRQACDAVGIGRQAIEVAARELPGDRRAVFRSRAAGLASNGRRVRSHRHHHRRRLGHPARGADGVGEAVRAREARIGRVGDRAVGVDHHRAVGALGDSAHALGRSLERVVAQHIDHHRLSAGRAGAVIEGVLLGRDRDIESGSVGQSIAVGDSVGNRRYRPIPVWLRRKCVPAVRRNGN